jgi:hypothetical protein
MNPEAFSRALNHCYLIVYDDNDEAVMDLHQAMMPS